MSIRTKILTPLLLFIFAQLALALFASFASRSDQSEIATILGKSIDAWELAHNANEDFRRLNDVVAEVTAMTHFIDATKIQTRFGEAAASMVTELEALAAISQSPEMTQLDRSVRERFAVWRGEAEGVLGLMPVREIATIDLLKRDGAALERALNDMLRHNGVDARARVDDVGARTRAGTNTMLVFSILIVIAGALGAFRLAAHLVMPIKALVASADLLARGDVSVTFAATERRDEIGDIARAVAAFRDNVTVAQAAESAAARERQAAETMRRQNEAKRSFESQELARVVDALSEGLERLARGDLTYRVEAEFGAEYARLKTNFNKSLDALSQALSLINEGARDLQSGSAEIADLAADLSSRAGSQTSSIEVAAASLETITATVQKTAGEAAQARGVVARTRDEAGRSGQVVRTAVEAIGRIQQSSQEIEKIIGVIDEIAFQTSLLALNAGVEAARAGETGRGFAVVATEVRALAQRSADASKEIKGLISASSAQVKQGVDLVVSAGAALERIFAQVSEIDHSVGEIAGAAAEQANGVRSVNNGVSAIDRMNQSNVDVVERTSSACASVAERAEQLMGAVAKFQVVRETARQRRAA